MKRDVNTFCVLMLVGCLAITNIYSATQAMGGATNEVKATLENLGQDFKKLGAAIKSTSEKRTSEVKTKINDWAQMQAQAFKESQANIQDSIEKTKAKIQAKIDEIATSPETKDEAKVNTLLKQLAADIDTDLQNLEEDSKAAKEKFEATQKDLKAKWNESLEALKAAHQNNVQALKDSLNEAKSYAKGFKDLIKRKMSEPFASSAS